MNAQHLSWDSLATFLETARAGTLVRAGEKLGVNHSTVHRRIAALERELRTQLFERTSKGYRLTPAGEELFEHVEAMEAEVEAIGRKVRGRDQSLEGLVRVATVDDLATYLLPSILTEFRRAHPAVTVQIQVAAARVDLTKRVADIAFRMGSRPDSPLIRGRRVGMTTNHLYGSRAYLERRGRPELWEDLAGHDIVRGDEGFAHMPTAKVLDRYTEDRNAAFRSNSMLVRLEAVKAGLGIGFLPYFIADSDPDLEMLALGRELESASLWMLMHQDIRHNARVRAFADFAYERLRAQRHLLQFTHDR